MIRAGIGCDAHRLVEGRRLVLGGVEIPFDKGLEGHSDGDALLHAICDALLGAAGLPDIGAHFPPGDETCRGISSLKLLRRVVGLIREKDHRPAQIDSVVVAQDPRIAPHADEMRKKIAETTGLNKDDVNVKATTTEGMGFEGRGEGISAHAVALIGPASD